MPQYEGALGKEASDIIPAVRDRLAGKIKTKMERKTSTMPVMPSSKTTGPTDVEKASKALKVDLEEEKDETPAETKTAKAPLSDESKQKLTSTIRDTFGEEFADITDEDIMEMYEAGDFDDLDDETLAALGLK